MRKSPGPMASIFAISESEEQKNELKNEKRDN